MEKHAQTKREKWTTIEPEVETVSDAEKAKRYRRKLEDLSKAANDLLLALSYNSMSKKQTLLLLTLVDEVALIRKQLDNENEFNERYG